MRAEQAKPIDVRVDPVVVEKTVSKLGEAAEANEIVGGGGDSQRRCPGGKKGELSQGRPILGPEPLQLREPAARVRAAGLEQKEKTGKQQGSSSEHGHREEEARQGGRRARKAASTKRQVKATPSTSAVNQTS